MMATDLCQAAGAGAPRWLLLVDLGAERVTAEFRLPPGRLPPEAARALGHLLEEDFLIESPSLRGALRRLRRDGALVHAHFGQHGEGCLQVVLPLRLAGRARGLCAVAHGRGGGGTAASRGGRRAGQGWQRRREQDGEYAGAREPEPPRGRSRLLGGHPDADHRGRRGRPSCAHRSGREADGPAHHRSGQARGRRPYRGDPSWLGDGGQQRRGDGQRGRAAAARRREDPVAAVEPCRTDRRGQRGPGGRLEPGGSRGVPPADCRRGGRQAAGAPAAAGRQPIPRRRPGGEARRNPAMPSRSAPSRRRPATACGRSSSTRSSATTPSRPVVSTDSSPCLRGTARRRRVR